MKPKTLATFMTMQSPHRRTPEQAWMLTFADLTGLLLCFFILFYSTLTLNKDHWQAMVGSFAATFAPSAVAVAVVPNGQYNALPVVRSHRAVLYLDTVLRQRVAEDPLWRSMRGVERPEENAFVYGVSPAMGALTNPLVAKGWARLGAAVRTWQTPLAVRVLVGPEDSWAEAAAQSLALAQAAAQGGARVTAEVSRGSMGQIQWVLYGAE